MHSGEELNSQGQNLGLQLLSAPTAVGSQSQLMPYQYVQASQLSPSPLVLVRLHARGQHKFLLCAAAYRPLILVR